MVKSVLLVILVSFSSIMALDDSRDLLDITSGPASIVLEKTDDVKTICAARKCIRKCCPKDQYFIKANLSCAEFKGNFDFANIPVYDDNDYALKINKTLSDIFLLEPGKFYDSIEVSEAGNMSFYSIMHKLSDYNISMYLTESGNLYMEAPNAYKRWTLFDHFCIEYEVNETIIPKYWAFISLPSDFKKPSIYNSVGTYNFPGFSFHKHYHFTVHIGNTIKTSGRLPGLPSERVEWTEPVMRSQFIKLLKQRHNGAQNVICELIVSSLFLLIVLLVYILLPELRNLVGLVLMAYVLSLMVAFLSLATLQLGDYTVPGCLTLTSITYFSFLATFCWMNVMSYDIWWTFRGYAKARPIYRRGEKFKFGMYCLYAWGVPLLMTIGLLVINNTDLSHMPWFITPQIPQDGCFLERGQKLVYLYIPMLILIICNWLFFLMTAFNIWRLNRGTAVLDSACAGSPAAHRNQRNRLMVYLKLSVIMGINWVLEVINYATPNLIISTFTDSYNQLIGLSIFLIFVCKKKIYRRLCDRYYGYSSNKPRLSKRHVTSHAKSNIESDGSHDIPLQASTDPNGVNGRVHKKEF